MRCGVTGAGRRGPVVVTDVLPVGWGWWERLWGVGPGVQEEQRFLSHFPEPESSLENRVY